MAFELTEGSILDEVDSLIEERELLKQKQDIEKKEGVIREDNTVINVADGIYPRSFFDLKKYPTQWKLVIYNTNE